MTQIGNLIDTGKFKKRPRYTMILHQAREKLDLSVNTYIVVDSIHKLSSSHPSFPYCVMSKADLAAFLGLGERTVFRCIKEAEDKKLIEKHDVGLRATDLWIRTTEVYDIKARD